MAGTVGVDILLYQLKDAHSCIEATMEGVTDKVAAFQPEGKANPLGGTYMHLLMSEDMFIQMSLQGKKPLFMGTWKTKTGASAPQPDDWVHEYPKWLRSVKVDIKQARAYAKAVNNASEKYVSSLTDKDLKREIDMSDWGMGKKLLSEFLGSLIIGHARDIHGEISVLKGIQGLKGYPW